MIQYISAIISIKFSTNQFLLLRDACAGAEPLDPSKVGTQNQNTDAQAAITLHGVVQKKSLDSLAIVGDYGRMDLVSCSFSNVRRNCVEVVQGGIASFQECVAFFFARCHSW